MTTALRSGTVHELLHTPSEYERVEWGCTPLQYLKVPLQHFRNSQMYGSGVATYLDRRASRSKYLVSSIFSSDSVQRFSHRQVMVCSACFALCAEKCTHISQSVCNVHMEVNLGTYESVQHFLSRARWCTWTLSPFCATDSVKSFLSTRSGAAIRSGAHSNGTVTSSAFLSSSANPPNILFGSLKEVGNAVHYLSVRFSFDHLATVREKT